MDDKAKRLKILFIQKDLKVTQIAREIGVSQQAVTGAICGRWASRRVFAAVAERLGITVQELRENYIPDRNAA